MSFEVGKVWLRSIDETTHVHTDLALHSPQNNLMVAIRADKVHVYYSY